MAKADRLARYDEQRIEDEADYRAALIAALKETAAGAWGLFDHGQDRWTRARAAPVLEALADLAERIDERRDLLGMEPYQLHRDFLAARGRPSSPSAVGEPKQARQWLERLGAD